LATVQSRKNGSVVAISSQVIDPANLNSRVEAERSRLDKAAAIVVPGGAPVLVLDAHAERLHQLFAVRLAGPSDRGRGPRGRLVFELKRVASRLRSWDAEAETARFATDLVGVIDDLERRVESLQESNEQLQRELRRRDRASGAHGSAS
jgi:hypothetical protein